MECLFIFYMKGGIFSMSIADLFIPKHSDKMPGNLLMHKYSYKIPEEQNQQQERSLEEDFDDFLDDSFETTEMNEVEISDNTANYLIYRYNRNVAKQEEYAEKAKAILEDYKTKVMAWLETRQAALNYDNDNCIRRLQEYYEHNAANNSEKLKLPAGTIGYYKKARSIKINNAELSSYYDSLKDEAEKAAFKRFLKPKTAFDLTKLKAACTVDEERNELVLDGFSVPGSSFTPGTTEFKVRNK